MGKWPDWFRSSMWMHLKGHNSFISDLTSYMQIASAFTHVLNTNCEHFTASTAFPAEHPHTDPSVPFSRSCSLVLSAIWAFQRYS